MKGTMKRKEGQAMVEYIIIVVIVAISALALFGLFGDRLKQKLGGAVDQLDGGSEGQDAASGSSLEQLQELGKD